MLRVLLSHFIFDVKKKKYILSIVIKQDVICQLLIKNYNFLSWLKVNAKNLISIAKSSCEREFLTKKMNLI